MAAFLKHCVISVRDWDFDDSW